MSDLPINTAVKEIAKAFYNIVDVKVQKLNSYDGLNFLLQPEIDDCLQKRIGHHILKFIPSDSTLLESCKTQVEVMIHLHAKGFCCPAPVMASNGHYIWQLNLEETNLTHKRIADLSPPENGFFMVTLLKFISGRLLSSLHPVPYDLFYKAGQMLARLHKITKTYEGSSQSLKDLNSNSIWSLEQAGEVCNNVEVVKDEELSVIIIEVVNRFKKTVLPRLSQLPQGIIHGDYNDDNIIIQGPTEGSHTPSPLTSDKDSKCNTQSVRFSISGVIDFSDMSYSCLVFDIAKALSFMVITDVPDIVVTSRYFLQGYSSVRELSQLEKDILVTCIMVSLAQNIVLALKDYDVNPNNPYLLASMDDYPVVLKKLYHLSEEDSISMWEG